MNAELNLESLGELGLTPRQQLLVRLIGRRLRYDVPAVQRDLAEEMGIRRDSLNKLLARTRRQLFAHGRELGLPRRCRADAVAGVSLSALVEV